MYRAGRDLKAEQEDKRSSLVPETPGGLPCAFTTEAVDACLIKEDHIPTAKGITRKVSALGGREL